ncbi:MAG TPA: VCBS repeat-containing protein, partial [Planctomycetota bacterium]|nr:VCBS repeat-containing protein [Planctomycetota bacterium]
MQPDPLPIPAGLARIAWRGPILACAVLLTSLACTAAGQCPPGNLPLTHAPIAGLDAHTVVLGQFEDTFAMLDAQGEFNVVKSGLVPAPGGVFGTGCAGMPVDAAVAIYHSGALDLNHGTLEMWVKPGADTVQRQSLFSLQGTKSLDGDGFNDLIVGQPLLSGPFSVSNIYFDNGSGLDLSAPARFTSEVPRGIEVGDMNGDG